MRRSCGARQTPRRMAEKARRTAADALGRDVAALRVELAQAMRDRFQRDLPFDELVSDRWDRARQLGFGDGTSVYASSYVYGDVRIGRDCWIGPFSILDGSGATLTIGDHCDISAGVQIYTHDTVARAVSSGRADVDRAPVTIGSSCHIGAHTVIARGVTIGDHSVIGAGSFVNRDIPTQTVAVGTPCRPIGRVVIDNDGKVRLEYAGDA